MHSHFGTLSTTGLNLVPGSDYGHQTQMRNVQWDAHAEPGWTADWHIEDRYGLLKTPRDIHLRYTDLTTGAVAGVAEGWLSYGGFADTDKQDWIPRVLTRRTTDSGVLSSTFVGVIEPYEGHSSLAGIRRIPMNSDHTVAVEITHTDGTMDLLLCADDPGQGPGHEMLTVDAGWHVCLCGRMAFVRRSSDGHVVHMAAAGTKMLTAGSQSLQADGSGGLLEWSTPR